MCHCLQFLDESKQVAEILIKLCTGTSESEADVRNNTLAYQIAFDLVESENQVHILYMYLSNSTCLCVYIVVRM